MPMNTDAQTLHNQCSRRKMSSHKRLVIPVTIAAIVLYGFMYGFRLEAAERERFSYRMPPQESLKGGGDAPLDAPPDTEKGRTMFPEEAPQADGFWDWTPANLETEQVPLDWLLFDLSGFGGTVVSYS